MERIRAWEREQSNSKLGFFYRRTRHSKRTHTQQHDTNNTTAWKGMVQHSGRERRGGGAMVSLGLFFSLFMTVFLFSLVISSLVNICGLASNWAFHCLEGGGGSPVWLLPVIIILVVHLAT